MAATRSLRSLDLRSFRNYSAFRGAFTPDVHLIVGPNAQGKTNLLEAIHYLSALRSFRGTAPKELIRFGEEAAVVRGSVAGSAGTDELAVTLTDAGRSATVNGKDPDTIAEYLRVLPSVKFTPDDLLVIKGEGGPRRRALDRAVFGVAPSHLKHLLDYNRALKQKNAALRTGRATPAELDVWNDALAEHGSRVIASRLEFIRNVEPLLAEFHAEISASKDVAGLRYRGLDGEASGLAAALRSQLAARAEEERMRGHTVVGPHRDDLVMEIGGRSVRKYASQGQHRMFTLALKVAEIELHRRLLGSYPLLLLDDVKSELDHDRVRYLFGFLNRIPAQIFVTATDLAELSGEVTRPYRVWRVEAGVATASD